MSWCEICKTGKFKAKNGKLVEVTENDLDKIVTEFSAQTFPAPIVIGHPKDNSPAFGWVDSVKREGNKLFAKFKDVVPEFAELVNQKVYPNRSLAYYPNHTIKHVGFLGGTQPAIKSLAPYQFSEDEEAEIIEFSASDDYKFRTIGNILQDLRDFLIERYDIETADKLVSTWRIEDLKTIETAEAAAAFCEALEKTAEITVGIGEHIASPEASELPAEFSEQLNMRDTKIANLEAEIKQKEFEAKKKEHIEFCEGLVSEGKLTPANRATAMNLLELASNAGVYEFSECGEANAEEQVKQFLNASPKAVELSEIASEDNVEDEALEFSEPAESAKQIKEYADKHGVDVLEAKKALKKGKNKKGVN